MTNFFSLIEMQPILMAGNYCSEELTMINTPEISLMFQSLSKDTGNSIWTGIFRD